ncbi:hypothetical protein LINPERHAP1_LOCUS12626, partial [Linum perenne]
GVEIIGRGYFSWNTTLENHLIQCMVEMARDNHVENGSFKGGAYKELEKMMEVRSPECGVQAHPHIKSKLKLIKQRFQAYQLCWSQSGWGWDDIKKCPVVDRQLFVDFVKNNPSCRDLNGLPFPPYEDLLSVFGKGRAIGDGAVAANEDTNPVNVDDFASILENDPLDEEEMARYMENIVNEVVDMPTPNTDRHAQPANTAPNAGTATEGKRQKKVAARRLQMEATINEIKVELSELKPAMDKAMDNMMNRLMGEEADITLMRHAIMDDVESLPGLTHQQVIDVASFLSRDENVRNLQFFYKLRSEDDRLYFILRKLEAL